MQDKLALFGLETSNLTFRKFQNSDAKDWLEFCKDESYWKYFNMTHEKTYEAHCQDWVHNINNRYENNLGAPNAVLQKSIGKLVAIAGLLVQQIDNKNYIEVSYSFMPWARGKGWATEAAKFMRDYAFENNLADELISTIHIENLPSQKVAQRNGMEIKFQTIHKNVPVYIFAISKDKWLKLKQNHEL